MSEVQDESAVSSASQSMGRLSRTFVERPLVALAIYAVVGILLIAGAMYQVVSDAAFSTAREAAVSYSAAVTALRNYYSSEVVPRARAAGVVASHDYRNIDGAIPLPATLTIELGEQASQHTSGGEFRLFSEDPFPWRFDGGPRDDTERAMFDAVVTGGAEEFTVVEKVGGRRFLRYATPVRMKESCIGCHNDHPQTPRGDWSVGDVRGVQSVRLPMPDLLAPANFPHYGMLVFLFAGLAGGLVLFALLLRHLQRSLATQGRLLDLTRKRNEELDIAKSAAEASSRSKSEFLANMSHELRTPLNAVIGFSEVIKEELFGDIGDRRYADYANDIHGSGRHLLDLINDILDLSKVETGMEELYEEDIAMPELIREVQGLVQHHARQKGIELTLTFPDGLALLRADRRKIKQILVNLVTNAIKFTENGGAVTFTVDCDPDAGYRFVIADTGIGMAPEDIPKALSQFGQIESALNRRHEGTGLGLPLAKGLTELHGGRLAIDSAPGAGTTVTVTLPPERAIEFVAALTREPADYRKAS